MSVTSLHRRGNTFYFYIRIPRDVKSHFNRQFIFKSLKTNIRNIAKKRVDTLAYKASELFERIRSGMFKERIDILIYQFINHELGFDFLDEPTQYPTDQMYDGGNLEREKIIDFQKNDCDVNIAMYKKCLETNDYSCVASHPYLSCIDLPEGVAESQTQIDDLSRKLTHALLNIEQLRLDRLNNNFDSKTEQIVKGLYSKGQELIKDLSISKVFEEYANKRVSNREWSKEKVKEKKSYLKTIIEILGDIKINKINNENWNRFLADIQNYPKNRNGKILKKHTYQEIKVMKHLETLEISSINTQYIQTMIEVVRYAASNNYFKNGSTANIINKISTKSVLVERREIFSETDLLNIFNAMTIRSQNNNTRKSVIRKIWIALIALYSGMRQLEILQLCKNNIVQINGVYCFDLSTYIPTESYRLKTDADRIKLNPPIQLIKNNMSKRTIPIHMKLIELGLLDYIEAVESDGVFIKSNDDFGKETRLETCKSGYRTWFTKLKKIDNAFEGKKSFHSFRHTFLSKARQNLLMQEIYINFVAGHTPTKSELGSYAAEYLPIMKSAVDFVNYDFDVDSLKEILAM